MAHRTVGKYLVISYDNDEQQTFWDWVWASDEEKAGAFVEPHRPYINAVTEVFTAAELMDAAQRLQVATKQDVAASMKELVDQFVEAGGC